MYNEDIKRRFISERNEKAILPLGYLENQFNKLEEKELELGKDVCNFTAYEITEYYKLMNIPTVESLKVLNSQLSIYTTWCLNQNLVKDNQNHFLEITTDMFYNLINKALFDMRIVSRDEVISWIKDLKNPMEQFVVLALFEGIRGKDSRELVFLKPEDVDGNTLTLYGGRKVNVSNKLISVIEDCIDTDVYYSANDYEIKLVNNGYVIKEFANTKKETEERNHGKRIYGIIDRVLHKIDQKGIITAKCLIESGKLDMIKRRSMELGITQKDYINSQYYYDEVQNQYGKLVYPKVFIEKYEAYLD